MQCLLGLIKHLAASLFLLTSPVFCSSFLGERGCSRCPHSQLKDRRSTRCNCLTADPSEVCSHLVGQKWITLPVLTAMESGKLNGLTDGTAAAYSKIKCKGQKYKHISNSDTSLSSAMFLLVYRFPVVMVHALANPSQFNLTIQCQRPCITSLLSTHFPRSDVPGIF